MNNYRLYFINDTSLEVTSDAKTVKELFAAIRRDGYFDQDGALYLFHTIMSIDVSYSGAEVAY